ncbi:MAG: DUF2141 domain-containing protein [Archangium sp.]|nr:DUF2141 domain-containing protein [Archangium sp.]
MKRSLLSLLLVACGGGMSTPTPTITLEKGQSVLTVHVERVKTDKGPVLCDLFNAADGFPGASPIIGGSIRLEASAAPVCTWRELPAGSYAVSVIQDENANGSLDMNTFGVPTEGYGASNNVLPATSAPRFVDSALTLDGTAASELTVRLKN